jgi:phytoene synthase
LPGDAILGALLEEWRLAAHEAVAGSERLQSGVTPGPHAGAQRSPSPEFADRLAALDWRTSLPSHGRSFAFASRWFPAERRERVARVYAYCRFTDDIVDDAGSRTPAAVERDLDEWRHLSRKAYDGHATGYAFLDDVMHDAATAAVSFRYIEQLVEGVRMDLRAVHFDTLGDLQGYTYRVASVVGLWMCGLFGVHRKGVLARAASLGHAMQITNILRDVGEDLDRGRVYLPRQLMQQNGVTLEDLRAMRSGAPISAEYCSFIEELIAVADVAYDAAFLAIPELPSDTQSPIAIASYVYRGIHDAIRRNGYDNLNQRAHTTVIHKARLAAAALRRLRRVAADRPLAPTDETIVPDTRIVQSFAR